ncbi:MULTISPECIES: ParB/RepB/Spo0J family partition protein [Gordonia]|uniref:ParB/RepB/Spo0J family partition protein n=1 Tax=Gordonia TaxID=2053 RepID=UPI0005F018A7|nr:MULTISPECIES: ParB N-terminal domain-containing protein [Gordonia]KJR05506.1 hypothetical protein UG54_16240 [Gordonia sihwensis]WFN95183.1 ParB N-terminal domain-containing protein [Gordonia sihwensis]
MTTTNAPAAELRHVDPTTVAIADNIRTNTAAVTDLADKVADGVLVPILAYLADDGTVTVIDGQLRTLAAREAGLATIPAYIVPVTDPSATDTERIIAQYITNEHRTELLPSERAKAIEQLHLAGMSASKIAKKLRRTKAEVDHSLIVAKSTETLDNLDTLPELTLEQAAVLAEYTDDPEATDDLLEALYEGRFHHMAQYLADTADQRAAIAAAGADLEAAGITWGKHYQGRALREFVKVDNGTAITIEDVPTEHRYARVFADEETTWTAADGTAVDETLIDWSLKHNTDQDAAPADGMIDPRTLTQHTEVRAEIDWHIINPQGLETVTTLWEWRRANPTQEIGKQITEQQRAEEEEAARQARRRVKILNKKAVAAREVRITHLTSWFTRKTLPKEHKQAISQFVSDTMWSRYELFGTARQDGDARSITAAMLGIDERDMTATLADAAPERAQLIGLAIAVGAHESIIAKDTWRDPYGRRARTAYLDFIAEVTGYTLADIEKAIAGHIDPNTIDLD